MVEVTPPTLLSGVVVHWANEEDLVRLIAAWPRDGRFELLVVDNSGTAPALPAFVRRLEPGHNLGFAGGVNAGVRAARSDVLLLLNPDACPEPGALEEILSGLAARPDAAGIVPRLLGTDGESQARWQLRPLPTACTLLLQTLFVPAGQGSLAEPPSGAAIEQPAAAALALRRRSLDLVGGLDEQFFPAWFEDVDLASRLRSAGLRLVYWPAARFRHGLGASLPKLGYGPFLWIYYRNLVLYLRKHHGRLAAGTAVPTLLLGMALRLSFLPLRRPKRAKSRWQAAVGLVGVMEGALSSWTLPRPFAARYAPTAGPGP